MSGSIGGYFNIFKLAQIQYFKKDDKWIITLNKYLQDKAFSLAKSKIYDDALVCYNDCLNLIEVLKEKYISSGREDLSERMSSMIKGISKIFCDTYACKLFINIPHIEFDSFEQHLKLELKKVGKYEINDDDIKNAFFSVACDFPEKTNIDDLRNVLSILNLEDMRSIESAKYCLQKKQKILRKKIFDWLGTPSVNRDYLKEIYEGQMLLVDVSRMLSDRIGEMLNLATFYRYKAYSENSLEDITENFDQSISILSNLVNQHTEDESMARELIFTKARKAEYLAFFHDDLGERIKQLKKARRFYGLANDPRSFLASFLGSYYKIKKHIIHDQDIFKGVEEANRLFNRENQDLDSLVQKYPDVETLIYTCLLVHYYPVTMPSESKLKKLNFIYNKIVAKMKSLYPLWGIVNSYNTLIYSMGDNKELRKYFNETFIAFIKSGKISDMEKVAERLFFVTPTEDVSKEFIEIIRKEEGQELEFKGSFSLNVKEFLFTNKKTFETELENEAFAAIVGFLNSSGGTLVLGVLEKRKDLTPFKDKVSEKFNKLIFGVEREYHRDAYDGFIRRIEDIIRKRIDPNLPSLLKIKKNVIDEHDLVEITIPKGEKWYYLDNEVFFVREHNQTITKKGEYADEYKLRRAR